MAPQRKGFANKYKIKGDTTIIYLEKRTGEIFETFIDTEDLDKLIKLDLPWHTQWFDYTKSHYAAATKYYDGEDGRRHHTTVKLHGIIMNTNESIDHINHNTLDNRKKNLRLTNKELNGTHRKGKNSNNKSGYRNVSKIGKWWCVQIQIEGKNTMIKKFPLDQLDEAGAYAEKMRDKYYGEYKGLN